ncbi:MAG: HAMP domain-containing histidine kinase [Bdellovibrionales bacterium]|nr:HAMP domain-containing histidine kinase [Bdellovibrionales bacterium]
MSAIGHLAGNIAHELNNPLTGIRSLCQVLLQNQSQQGQVYSDLKEVEMAAARSQKIITNLLNFSKGADRDELKVVSLNELVETTLPLLKSVTSVHQREIHFTLEKTLVKVDPHLTQQVIFNLINNACQAMKEPGRLEIQTSIEGDWVQFTVSDSGPGIPLGLGKTIFDPFVTTKSETGGTGLGLSMSQRVIHQFGGELAYDKDVSCGAKFWFKLPQFNGEENENTHS